MKKKILLADDEPHFVITVKDRLEMLGYEVITASNGKDALKKIKESPDLILLDIVMPEMNGYEVCEKLKENPETKEIPIVIFTASGQRDLEEKCMSAGATEVLRKPFEAAELVELVNKFLNRE